MAGALRFRAQGAATRLGPMIVSTLAALVFPLLMALAASSDLITMRISNRLVAVLVVGFFVLAFAAQLPLQQIAMHTGLAVMVLAFGFAFFSFGWIGGGEAASLSRSGARCHRAGVGYLRDACTAPT